jgi:Zn-dependent protease
MLEVLLANPIAFLITFPGLLASITFHEFAHAWTADHLGDPTPRYQGRVTLDPRAHLDPLGTLSLFLTRFGWGRPVEFDPYNLKNPLRDTALIALAGPLSNLSIAAVCSVVLHLAGGLSPWLVFGLTQLILINITLAVFNLVPIHPLDGGKIMVALLPPELAEEYDEFMHRYGLFVLLLLIVPWRGGAAPISQLISPFISFFSYFLL